MAQINEQLERLIVRHLDGELSMEEELALQKELLKNPAARQLAGEYARLDMVAGSALKETLAGGFPAHAPPLTIHRVTRQRHWSRAWVFIPGAIAAALLAMVIPFPGAAPVTQPAGQHLTGTADRLTAPQHEIPQIGPHAPDGVMRTVSDSPWLAPRTRRDTGREMIGVQGDDGNIYWLEISRTRTIRQPERAPVALPVTESL